MNHKAIKDIKKRGVVHWSYVRLLTITVSSIAIVTLILIVSFRYYTLHQYQHYYHYWIEDPLYGKIILNDESGTQWAGMTADIWTAASQCVRYNWFCNIKYNEHYKYPEYIESIIDDWWLQVTRFDGSAYD
jgi:hypothetical protein